MWLPMRGSRRARLKCGTIIGTRCGHTDMQRRLGKHSLILLCLCQSAAVPCNITFIAQQAASTVQQCFNSSVRDNLFQTLAASFVPVRRLDQEMHVQCSQCVRSNGRIWTLQLASSTCMRAVRSNAECGQEHGGSTMGFWFYSNIWLFDRSGALASRRILECECNAGRPRRRRSPFCRAQAAVNTPQTSIPQLQLLCLFSHLRCCSFTLSLVCLIVGDRRSADSWCTAPTHIDQATNIVNQYYPSVQAYMIWLGQNRVFTPWAPLIKSLVRSTLPFPLRHAHPSPFRSIRGNCPCPPPGAGT